jgi:hypothetical protein
MVDLGDSYCIGKEAELILEDIIIYLNTKEIRKIIVLNC